METIWFLFHSGETIQQLMRSEKYLLSKFAPAGKNPGYALALTTKFGPNISTNETKFELLQQDKYLARFCRRDWHSTKMCFTVIDLGSKLIFSLLLYNYQ